MNATRLRATKRAGRGTALSIIARALDDSGGRRQRFLLGVCRWATNWPASRAFYHTVKPLHDTGIQHDAAHPIGELAAGLPPAAVWPSAA